MKNTTISNGAKSFSPKKKGYIKALKEAKKSILKLIKESSNDFDEEDFKVWFEEQIKENQDPTDPKFIQIKGGVDENSYSIWKDCSIMGDLQSVTQYYIDKYHDTHPGAHILYYEEIADWADKKIQSMI